LIDDASAEAKPGLRAQKYSTADKMLCKDLAIIAPLFLSTQSLMVKPWVKNIEFNSLDLQFFKDVYIDNKQREGS
jgi:ABC-type oligopeptide transport system substrate-binding subunit